MLVVLAVSVVLLDDLIEEGSEGIVRVVGASIDTNARLGPLASREDGLLEGEAELVVLVLQLFPDLWCKALGEEGLSASGEVGEISDLFR